MNSLLYIYIYILTIKLEKIEKFILYLKYRLFLSIACIDGKSDFVEVSKNLDKYKSENITAKYNWALGVSAGCYIAQC